MTNKPTFKTPANAWYYKNLYEPFLAGKNLRHQLNLCGENTEYSLELSCFFFFLSSRGQFAKFKKHVGDWRPENPGLLRANLVKAAECFSEIFPTQADLIRRWWEEEWSKAFMIGNLPLTLHKNQIPYWVTSKPA